MLDVQSMMTLNSFNQSPFAGAGRGSDGSDPGSWFGGETLDLAAYAAGMAAGAPVWADPLRWVTGQVGDLYDTAYNWVSDNVSRAPIGTFSTLASVAPGGLPGVRFEIPIVGEQDVLGVVSGSKWSSGSITYSLPDSRSDYQWINPSAAGYRSLGFATEQAVRFALEGYSPHSGGPRMGLTSVEAVTNLSLEYAGRDAATLQISGFNPGSMINRSHAFYPGVPMYGGDVWIQSEAGLPGTHTYMAVLHEIGHALGLKHPHDSGGALPTMSADKDSPEYTVMSYGHLSDHPQTYMQYDVAALQALYGADFTTNGGSTTYRWSPQTGETFVNGVGQGSPDRNTVFLTIWDGGGTDTYDLSNYDGGSVVDLAPGGYVKFSQDQLARQTSGAGVHGNVYNAFQYKGDSRSLIENAIGGNGHDDIRGNAANNALTGNGGDDTLAGAGGNDTLTGGAGADHLRGGAGADRLDGGAGTYDTLEYSDASDGVAVNLGTSVVSGGYAAGDIISGFENLIGGNGSDVLYGSSAANVIFGSRGSDQIVGSGGQDYLSGDEGDDMLIVNEGGGATMAGGAGDDRFVVFPGTHARILDFTAGSGPVDEILIYKNVFASFAEVRAAAVDAGGGTTITKGAFSIEIAGVRPWQLHADDFYFLSV
ncbi:MAG: M10 family metallopeptidase [Microvirga sp.]